VNPHFYFQKQKHLSSRPGDSSPTYRPKTGRLKWGASPFKDKLRISSQKISEIVDDMTGIKDQSERTKEQIITMTNVLEELTHATTQVASSSDRLLGTIQDI